MPAHLEERGLLCLQLFLVIFEWALENDAPDLAVLTAVLFDKVSFLSV
jgi:hypothetical protein